MNLTFSPADLRELARLIAAELPAPEQPATPTTETEPKLLYTTAEAAELLGMSQPALNKFSREGRIVQTKLGRSVRYSRAELERIAREGVD